MQNPKSLSLKMALDDAPKEPHWLETMELVSLAGSGVGLGVAMVSQQLINAAVPLTLSLGLSFVNRHRFQREIQQQNQAAMSQVYRTIQNAPAPANLQPLEQKMARLEHSDRAIATRVRTLEDRIDADRHADLSAIQAVATRTQEMETRLQRQIDAIAQRLEAIGSPDSQHVQQAIASLHRDLVTLQKRLAAIEMSDAGSIRSGLSDIHAQLDRLNRKVDPMQRQQRAMVKRLFPRIIATINELRGKSESVASKQAIAPQRSQPLPPMVRHSIRYSQGNPNGYRPMAQPQTVRATERTSRSIE